MKRNTKILIAVLVAALIVTTAAVSSAVTKKREQAEREAEMEETFGDSDFFGSDLDDFKEDFGGDAGEQTQQPADTGESGKPDRQGLGGSFSTQNGYQITLASVDRLETHYDETKSYYEAAAGNIFVRITLTIDNNSDGSPALYPYSGAACDGTKIEKSSNSEIADPDAAKNNYHDYSSCLVSPGESKTAYLYFEVPEDFKEITLNMDGMGQDTVFPQNEYLVVTHDDVFANS